jgi:hypothetical protein
MLCSIAVIVAHGRYNENIDEQVTESFSYVIVVNPRSDDKKVEFKPYLKVIERAFFSLNKGEACTEIMNFYSSYLEI